MLWHIGNTTVRTPYRLRDALRVLLDSPLNGNLSGTKQEQAFATLLRDKGVLDSPRIADGRDASDLGRKWRVALSQLGFITPQLNARDKRGAISSEFAKLTEEIEGLAELPYQITPNGHRLVQSELITAHQECFLRSLASYRIPSPIEDRYKCGSFSPLRLVLRVLFGLTDGEQEPRLSFEEFAIFVQTSTPEDDVSTIIERISDFRVGREVAKGHVRAYDRSFYEQAAEATGRKDATLDDYADLSLRYLKATGLLRTAGRGICLSPMRSQLSTLLCKEEDGILPAPDYLHTLWLGAKLPTDDTASSYAVVCDLAKKLDDKGVQLKIPNADAPLRDIENKRHELEEMLLQLDEKEYADSQADKLDEIFAWFEAIATRGSAKLPNGETVSIPRGEGPAYLEWAIWRAFLAIDNLCNQPWEARRFQIDQDFLPVSCAPGGGPDMVFEFKNGIVVVEVTLTASSRQEAAEGEPVRRHVADYSQKNDKSVYGLFIALKIDNNTAHTFRSGDWYLPDDSKLILDIVPLSLGDFRTFLASGAGRLSEMPSLLRQLLVECRAKANQDAPLWKASISSLVQDFSVNHSPGK